MSIGRIKCDTNVGSPKLTEPSSTFGNFKIEEAPSITSEDEIVVVTVVAAHQYPEREQSTMLRDSVADVAPKVGGFSQEIAELRHQGIDVDDDNEPSPENAQPSVPETQTIGQWVTPTIFPRRADVNCHNTKGICRQHSWQKNSEMTQISLFRMAFPEKWLRDVFITETKKEISGDDINLKEFYVYLVCQFFMACFEVISDRRLWWSPKPVSIW